MAILTCHTDGCRSAAVAIELDLTWVDQNDVTHTVENVTCGSCGQAITDIAEDREGST
ncbi:hypothetical protein P5P86_11740 [Nocardioides sp. BP30]|uniref:hypothetical protein n=1 Tax=Nocardioides sp. BP30 TaxID=3036374 RepID=UPI002468C572|nr:hypothetical protein [Nocardioides sp. BP30]WGL50636.1 hypothetical protein P5P86_11740 [Nocardioides sp. BP30]